MPAQAVGLGGRGNEIEAKPRRGDANRPAIKHTNNTAERDHRLGPPRWGFALLTVTYPQAVGLGLHRNATLWRKTELELQPRILRTLDGAR